ncbi:MAG: O-linked N-acetylglucosamine transferase family protein, partial [Methylobacter sp.]
MKGPVFIVRQVESALWLHFGHWLERKGIASLAEACYRNGATGNGKYAAEASFQLMRQLLDRDRNLDAVKVGEQALAHNPKHVKLWCALGAAKRRLAQMDGAREAYEQAIAIDQDYAQAWCNLGEWWLVKDDLPVALAKFEQALKLQPDLPEALNNRVAVLYELGRFDDAETAAREAILVYPDQAALHVNLGNVLLHTGKSRLAVKSLRKALELDPSSPEAHLGLSSLLGESHRLAETLAFFEHEIAVKGENAQRLASLALAQQSKGDWQAAERTCNKILEMQPSNISALITLGGCCSVRADHQGAIRLYQLALAENPRMPGIRSSIAFNATYLPDISESDLFAFHQDWAEHFEVVDNKQPFSYAQSTDPDRPLRIGYVSGDFGTHPVGFLLRDVILHHDRQQYSIYCYSMMRNSDNITAAIRENSDAWIDVLLMSDEELAEQINEDRIDILVDLSGHTAYNRLPTFVLKPAPVQVTWIGYFHSTGLRNIDYFITDPFTTPPGCSQLFSETPVCLPHSRFCYSPPEYAPEVVEPPVLGRGQITFGCFNRIEKLVDPVIATWVKILNAVPNSRLLLKSGPLENKDVRDRLSQRFSAYGLDTKRLELQGPSSHPEMLEQYGEIDIALDPFPFNGGMTTLEALWMGVPVVTLEGTTVVSRQTISALSNIGITDDLVFNDIDSYIAGAVALANNPS